MSFRPASAFPSSVRAPGSRGLRRRTFSSPDLRVSELVAEKQESAGLQLGVGAVRQGVGRPDVFTVGVLRVSELRIDVSELESRFSQLRIGLQRGAIFEDGVGVVLLRFERGGIANVSQPVPFLLHADGQQQRRA